MCVKPSNHLIGFPESTINKCFFVASSTCTIPTCRSYYFRNASKPFDLVIQSQHRLNRNYFLTQPAHELSTNTSRLKVETSQIAFLARSLLEKRFESQ